MQTESNIRSTCILLESDVGGEALCGLQVMSFWNLSSDRTARYTPFCTTPLEECGYFEVNLSLSFTVGGGGRGGWGGGSLQY